MASCKKIAVAPEEKISKSHVAFLENKDTAEILNVFKPFLNLWFLFSFGTRSGERARDGEENGSSKGVRYWCKAIVSRVMAWSFIGLLWADMVRFATIFRSDFSLTSSQATALSYLVYLGIQGFIATALYIDGVNKHFLHMSKLEKYVSEFGYHFDIRRLKTFSRYIYVNTVLLATLFGLVEYIPSLLTFVPPTSLFKSRLTPIRTDEQFLEMILLATGIFIFRVLFGIIMASCMFYFIFGVYFYYKEFGSVCLRLDSLVEDQRQNLSQKIENIRLQYEHLSGLLDTANGVLAHYIFTGYASGMVGVYLFLYALVNRQMFLYDIYAFLFANTNALILILSLTTAGSFLNAKVQAPMDTLLALDTTTMDGKTLNRVQLFSTRLACAPVGLNVYGMFVIGPSTILMVEDQLREQWEQERVQKEKEEELKRRQLQEEKMRRARVIEAERLRREREEEDRRRRQIEEEERRRRQMAEMERDRLMEEMRRLELEKKKSRSCAIL